MTTQTRVFDLTLTLPNAVNCDHCIGELTHALAQRRGVLAASRAPKGDKLLVDYDSSTLSPEELAAAVESAAGAVSRRYRHERLNVTGMDCPDCARTIAAGVSALPGVLAAQIEFGRGKLELAYDSQVARRDQIIARIRTLGYDVADGECKTLRFRLEGLDCADCGKSLEGTVGTLKGVARAEVNFGAATLTVDAEGSDDLVRRISEAVAQAGYEARLETAELERAMPRRGLGWFILGQRRGRQMLVAAVALLAGLACSRLPVPVVISVAFYAAAIVVGGYDVARSALAAVRTTRSFDMNVLMTVAVIGAALIGEWTEAAVVVLLFSLGNTLEAYTLDRTRDAVRQLLDLAPQEATLIHGDHEERVHVKALQVGDRVRVRPGERVPADGQVLEGNSAVDQAPITGESTPVDKQPGAEVFAGTINGHGALVVRVTQPATDSALARMVRLVEQAQGQRAPSQRFVDRFARIYTPTVIAIAAAIAALPPLFAGVPPLPWVYRALTLLVIACPCALVISTPVSIVSALGRAAGLGVLVKGGRYLEAAGGLRAMAFDKTRTLTVGWPAVTDVIPLGEQDADQVLTIAAAVERNSEHPLAQAVVREAERRGLVVTPAAGFQALPGRGARGRVDGLTYTIGNRALLGECLELPPEADDRLHRLEREGKTVFILGSCGAEGDPLPHEPLALIAVADRVRPGAAKALDALRGAGVRPIVMLTGDNAATAAAIGREVGVDQVHSNLLPDQKLAAIEELLAQHGAVGMVGDGVNDAPALARATVGIAMGAAGSDAALETADIALMGDDLGKLAYTVQLGRQTLQIIRQNIALSLLIKGAFVVLATLGVATLWMAVFADMGTSLIVTLNGMRLARR